MKVCFHLIIDLTPIFVQVNNDIIIRRNVGLQWTRWADQLKRLAGDQWSRSAKDRLLWKELEKKNFDSIGLAHL